MRALSLAFAACTLLACSSRTSTQRAPDRGQASLFVPAPSASDVPEGPLRVLHYTPTGETDGLVELTILFDRPMVALGTETSAADVFSLTPSVPGEVHWVGSQALVFRPRGGWPAASQFEVGLSPALRALDGQGLASPLAFSFSTPVPAVEHASPYDGSRGEELTRAIELAFNQAIDPAVLATHLKVTVLRRGVTSDAKVRVERPDGEDTKRLRIVPAAPWPRASEVTVEIAAGLTGQAGTRPLAEAYRTTFFTFDPLAFGQAALCGARPGARCEPNDGVAIQFTNPVKLKSAARALSFEPALTTPIDADEFGDYEGDHLYVYGGLKPLTRYTVSVTAPLSDVHGQKFSGMRKLSFETGPYRRDAYLPTSGELAEVGTHAQVPLLVRNLPRAQTRVLRLTAEELIARLAGDGPRGKKATPTDRSVLQRLPSVGPGEERTFAVDVTGALVTGHGVVEVEVLADGVAEPLASRTLAYTDLAPALKVGASGGAVWVTRLSNASAVAGADVRVTACGAQVARGKTGADGVLRFAVKGSQECELMAFVEQGDDLSFVRQYAGIGPYGLTEHSDPWSPSSTDVLLFTERGVYRPGETLHVKAIARELGDKGLRVERGEIALSVQDANGRALHDEKATLSEFGTLSAEIALPADVALGTLSVSARLGEHDFSTSAEVAEFKRAELITEVHADKPEYVQGESAEISVDAEYMFGAKVSGQPMTWAARRIERALRPAGERFDGFAFDDARRYFEDVQPADDSEVRGGEAKLDDQGHARLKIPLTTLFPGNPSSYELEATVDALGGASASGRTFVDVLPANFLVGVRSKSSLVATGAKIAVEAVAASPSGKLWKSVPLSVSLERHVVKHSATTDAAGARTEQRSVHNELVARCDATGPGDLRACELMAKETGLHFLRVEGKDARGRISTASTTLYVYGGQVASFGEEDGNVITLRSDKPSYKLGELARVVVPSPFTRAEALITVERENVMSVEHRSVTDGALVLDIPIDQRFVPNAFVSVLLVRARGPASEGDPGRPDFRIGVVELNADASSKKLRVELTPSAAVLAPGQKLALDLAVRDAAGNGLPAELTLFAVDEGVLALTGYRTPDPFSYFYRTRGLAVWTSDARGQLLAERELPDARGEKGGEEGGGGGASVRKDFRAVAHYAPRVLTDEQGRAHVEFTLPDSITRYRVMAVAVTRGAEFGAGATDVRTQKRLMLRPALPRVARTGDAFRGGVAVHNETDGAQDVLVKLDATGVTLASAPEQRVRIAAHAAQEVLFDLRSDKAGTAQLLFSASAGSDRDALLLSRDVRPPGSLETVATIGSTTSERSEQLAALPGVRDDVGGLAVHLSTSSIAQLADVSRALSNYPYACTEQLSSRLLGLSSLFALKAQGFEVSSIDRQALLNILAELTRRQRSDGGFVLWPEQDHHPSDHFAAFLTAYAVRALYAAESAGVADTKLVRASAGAFLGNYLRRARDLQGNDPHDATRVFVLEALAASGSVDGALLASLVERKASLSASSTSALFAVASAARDKQIAGADAWAAELLAELAKSVRMTAHAAHVETNHGDLYQTYMTSDLRATATMLMALLRYDAKHALVMPLARYLGDARGRDGTWGNTHDDAWGLQALALYVSVVERETPNFKGKVSLGGKELLAKTLKGRGMQADTFVPMASLPRSGAPLVLSKDGTGTMHHALSFSFVRSELAKTPLERGMFVERRYERIAPVDLMRGAQSFESTDTARVGDYVRVSLRVAIPAARQFVVIEDPMPAGLEPINTLFTTSSQASERALGLQNGPYDHRELFDDRVVFAVGALEPGIYTYSYMARAVTPGAFVVPVAKVEEMYHPETTGRTAAGQFRVTQP